MSDTPALLSKAYAAAWESFLGYTRLESQGKRSIRPNWPCVPGHPQIFWSIFPPKRTPDDAVVVVVGDNQTQHNEGLMGLVGSTKLGHSMLLLALDEGTGIHCCCASVLDWVSVVEECSSRSHLYWGSGGRCCLTCFQCMERKNVCKCVYFIHDLDSNLL